MITEKQKEYNRIYYLKNREERLTNSKEWMFRNKDKKKQYDKLYRKTNQEHIKVQRHNYFLTNQEQIKEKYSKYCKELKAEILNYYSNKEYPGCVRCGIKDIDVLCIDHINGGGNRERQQHKIKNIYKWLKRKNLPEGYQTLCANCNLKKKIREDKQ